MHFKDVVNMSDMVIGDRFYFLSDKKKEVFVLLDIESRRVIVGHTHSVKYVKALMYEKWELLKLRDKKFDITSYTKAQTKAEAVKAVFLRHAIKVA